MKTSKFLLILFLVLPLTFVSFQHIYAAKKTASANVSLEGVPPESVDSIIANMSEEQVRSLLVAELTKDLSAKIKEEPEGEGLVEQASDLLHVLDGDKNKFKNATITLSSITRVPSDYIELARKIGNGSLGRFILTVIVFSTLFGIAWLSEFFIRRFTANFNKEFQEKAIPDLDGPNRFVAGIMRSVPAFTHILAFSGSAILLFFLLPVHKIPPARYFFLTIFFIVLFYRILAQISLIFCSPQSPALRVLPIDDATANRLHKGILFFCNFTFAATMILALGIELGITRSSLSLTAIVFASFLIFIIIKTILNSRDVIRERILERSDLYKTRNWVVEQFAQFWHIPAILYFCIIWLITIGDQLAGVQRGNFAFLMSLMILPLFVIFNAVGQWVVRVSINTLQVYNPDIEDPEDEEFMEKQREAQERERKLLVSSGRLTSLGILATLLVWVLNLWGVHIPYATNITSAVFESLIALALGLTVWRFASSYIEKKIAESTPEVVDEEGQDDEWGGAAARGRSHTLLPMLRKFIASTLLVMVVLVVLSSLGIDIGPLLAGAGVVGLAIGFGAQKLVSDVFSGFFYLLDDAFRVGEYIKAGTVMGAVEAITLRNVMIRHHRGMLQIVPHSELGAITNFMRGGIIEKFNLEFPYDADVDKIRKVIKKVGQAMLKDEEFEGDFIQPVKSAGVREITGSVMVIRVKFKTQPGAQFVIRREAYRRITEALAAQGIHYAHRKVIVELPEHEKKELTAEEQRGLEAGAAAAILQQQVEEKKLAQEQTKK